MFRRLVSAWVMVGTILVGGTVKAQRPFPVNIVPKRTALERLGLERQWFGVVPLVETERLLRISVAGKAKPDDRSMLFAQTSYAMVHAFDAETGRLIWSAQLGERTGFARGVAANSFAVFVTNADTLFALDKNDRPTDLEDGPRHDSHQPASLRRGAGDGRADDRARSTHST